MKFKLLVSFFMVSVFLESAYANIKAEEWEFVDSIRPVFSEMRLHYSEKTQRTHSFSFFRHKESKALAIFKSVIDSKIYSEEKAFDHESMAAIDPTNILSKSLMLQIEPSVQEYLKNNLRNSKTQKAMSKFLNRTIKKHIEYYDMINITEAHADRNSHSALYKPLIPFALAADLTLLPILGGRNAYLLLKRKYVARKVQKMINRTFLENTINSSPKKLKISTYCLYFEGLKYIVGEAAAQVSKSDS